MKKLASLILALLLIASLGLGALAEEVASRNVEPAVFEEQGALPGVEGGDEAGYADFVGDVAVSSVERYSDNDIYYYDEGLTSLDGLDLPADLLQFGCTKNKLTSLDMSKYPQLESLWCGENRLTSLNVTGNTRLMQLNCSSNLLTSLDLSKNAGLRYLWCEGNKLTALDLSKNTRLDELYASGNSIRELDLSNNRNLALAAGAKPKMKNGALHFEYAEENEEGDEDVYILEIDPNTTVTAKGKTLYGPAGGQTGIGDAKITVKDQAYTGKALQPAVTVKLGGKKLVKGTDYTVSYKSNIGIGKATVTVKGKGDYTGTVKGSFNINPKKVTGLALAAGSKRLTVSWKKAAGVTGYEIEYALKKDFSDAKTATVKRAATVKRILTKLQGGKTYYVRVRAFKTVKKVNYCSAWVKANKKAGK